MRNVTFRARAELIERARERAREQNTTLNALFRQWLASLAANDSPGEAFDLLMGRLSHVRSGGPFERGEMNER
jgi:hypothetical protein